MVWALPIPYKTNPKGMWEKYLIKPPDKSRYWGLQFSPLSKRY
jgi:hypothetical protein